MIIENDGIQEERQEKNLKMTYFNEKQVIISVQNFSNLDK